MTLHGTSIILRRPNTSHQHRRTSHWLSTSPRLSYRFSLVPGYPTHKTLASSFLAGSWSSSSQNLDNLINYQRRRPTALFYWLVRLDNRQLTVLHSWRFPDLWWLTVQLTSMKTRKQLHCYIPTFNSFLLLSNTLAFFYRRNEHFNQYIERTFSKLY